MHPHHPVCSCMYWWLLTKEPLIIGLFYGKWLIKIRHPVHFCNTVCSRMNVWSHTGKCCRSLSAKEPPMKGFFCGKWPIKISLPPCMFPHDWVISHRQMLQVSFFRWATNDRALLREMTYQNIFATLYVLTWMGYCTQANQSRHAYCTGWRRTVGCLKLQVIFHNRATDYRALL